METSTYPIVNSNDLPGLDDEAWPSKGPARGVRLRVPTLVLIALLIASAGLWGGAVLQRNKGGTSAGVGSAAAIARLRTFAGAGAARFGGLAGGATSRTSSANDATGTLTVLNGNTMYVTDASGALVKVTLSKTTTISRNATASASSLRPGDTVVVSGTRAKDGTLIAQTVTASAQGVSTGAGFGGRATAAGSGG